MTEFQKGDRITVISSEHAGRTGRFQWYSKLKMPGRDYRIILDLKGRERTEKTAYVETSALALSTDNQQPTKTMATSTKMQKRKGARVNNTFSTDVTVRVTNPESPYHNMEGRVTTSQYNEDGEYFIEFPNPTGPQLVHANDLELVDDEDNTEEFVPITFQPGDTIVVPTGPYTGQTATVKEVLTEKNRVVVIIGGRELSVHPEALKPRVDSPPADQIESAPAAAGEQPAIQVTEGEFRFVPLADIVPDPNQPRKYFGEADLQELTDSVREKGVIQSITVRPNPAGEGYMIVVGERRWRAATAVQVAFKSRNTIPALIRDLTDEEALDIQITENLQRRDVHPMEEALAIRTMLDHGKSLEEICARLGKGKAYVAARLKLADLIPEFQEAYLRGLVDHAAARLICTATREDQRILFVGSAKYETPEPVADAAQLASVINDADDDDWDDDDDEETPPVDASQPIRTEGLVRLDIWNVKSWANQKQHKLDSAKFKTEDPELYPEMGPCGTCRFNSSNTLVLFMEEGGGRICNNGACYTVKTQRDYQQRLQQEAIKPGALLVSGYIGGTQDKAMLQAAKEIGAVLDYNQYDKIYGLEVEPTWEEYLELYHDTEDPEYNEAEARAEFEEDLQKTREKRERHQAEIDAGTIRRAFDVTDNEYVYVRLKGGTQAAETLATGDKASVQIAAIQQKEARAKELDNEKVYGPVAKLLDEHEPYVLDAGPMAKEDTVALVLFVLEHGKWEIRRWLAKELGQEEHFDFFKRPGYDLLIAGLTQSLVNQLFRRAVVGGLINASELDYGRKAKPAAIMAIAHKRIPDQAAEAERAQQEIADKRQTRVDERIAELKAQTEKEVGDA